jgi:hypothetical protein
VESPSGIADRTRESVHLFDACELCRSDPYAVTADEPFSPHCEDAMRAQQVGDDGVIVGA